MLNTVKVGFIGAGNMSSALIKGLLANGVASGNILVSDSHEEKTQALSQDSGVVVCADNETLVNQADVVVLAVKPQAMEAALTPLAETLKTRSCLLVSVAAGVSLDSLRQWSHPAQAIVRCMPNTPALVQAGASALIANDRTSETQKAAADAILGAVGLVVWLDEEKQMDAVTALSGSGPAYFFLLMESMQQAAVELGLDVEVAMQLCLQTAMGAAKLAQSSDVDVAELRRRVTSPKGTTEAAIRQFEKDDFAAIVHRALAQAAQRSEELSASG